MCHLSFQLVHGPSTKTRVAYILSLLREPAAYGESTVMEEEEDESDVEDGDITTLNTEVASCGSHITAKCFKFLSILTFFRNQQMSVVLTVDCALLRLCCRP